MAAAPIQRIARIHPVALAGLIAVVAGVAVLWRATPSSALTRFIGAPRSYSIEQLTAGARLSELAFSFDGRDVLFSSDAPGGIFNLQAAAPERALTRSATDGYHLVSPFPRDGRVLFRHDRGGDELDHLCVLETDGRIRDLTRSGARAELVGWATDGRSFLVRSDERDPRYYDLYRHDAATYARTPFYQDRTGFWISAVSPDERWIALRKSSSFTDSDIALFDRRAGTWRFVTPHRDVSSHDPLFFDPSSRWLYYLSNEGREFQELRRMDPSTGRSERVEAAAWDITGARLSPRGTYRVTTVNADARAEARITEVATGRAVPLALPAGTLVRAVAFSPDETRVAVLADTDRTPEDVYVADLAGGRPVKLTGSANPDVDPEGLAPAEVVRYRSFDGLEIPALLHRPRTGERHPAIVYVHGGPGGQTRVEFAPLVQYLVNQGYVVLSVNNRGSSGYGKTFYMADDKKHGREPLWDCLEGKKWLATQPGVDPDRIAIAGASYGGYMVLAAMAFHPGVFAAGVDLFGVSNVLRALMMVPPWLAEFRDGLYQEVGNPWNPLEWPNLYAVSPLFSANRIARPLMVVQGANDARVPVAESEDIVRAVRKNHVPVDYLPLPDEGHGFQKRSTERLVFRHMKEFLDREMPAR